MQTIFSEKLQNFIIIKYNFCYIQSATVAITIKLLNHINMLFSLKNDHSIRVTIIL